MDLTGPIIYNGVTAQPATPTGGGAPLRGIVYDRANLSGVTADTNLAKSPNQDGVDASDISLGGRRLILNGTIYGSSVGDAFDYLSQVAGAYSPRSAMDADIENEGFIPLTFRWPTADLSTWSAGYIPQQVYARPEAGIAYDLAKREFGAAGGLSIPFSTSLFCRDPRRYLQSEQTVSIAADGSAKYSGGTVVPYRGMVAVWPVLTFVKNGAVGSVEIYSWTVTQDYPWWATFAFDIAVDFTGLANGTYTLDCSERLLRDTSGTSVGEMGSSNTWVHFVGGRVAVSSLTGFSSVTIAFREAWP